MSRHKVETSNDTPINPYKITVYIFLGLDFGLVLKFLTLFFYM